MRQLPTIARNAFMELIRQPVFLVLFTISATVCFMLASVPYFGFGYNDRPNEEYDLKLVENGALSVMLLSGLFAAVICASSSLAEEIRTGTALAVLSKPVSRVHFIVGKYLGLALALAVVTYANLVGVLLASRGAFDAYGRPDEFGTWIFIVFIGLALVLAGFLNYFLNKQFVPWAVFLTLAFMTAAFLVICSTDKDVAGTWWNPEAQTHANFSQIWVWETETKGFNYHTGEIMPVTETNPKGVFAQGVDWSLLQASLLVLFMLWVLAAVALMCSTRLGMMPTLIICLGVFLLGLMSDYFFGRPAQGGAFISSGDILLWQQPGEREGEFAAFRVEPRGVRSLPPDPVTVRLTLSTGQSQPNHLDDNARLVLGSSKEGDSDDARVIDFRVGRTSIISFGTIRDELAPFYIAGVLREEMARHADSAGFLTALRRRGVEMEEGVFDELKNKGRTPDDVARELAEEHKLTDIFPGHLAFWVYPEGEGELSMKAGQGGGTSGVSVVVEPGAWWAKMLYVFIPNWQLFWLADALGPGKAIPWSYVGRSFLYVLAYLGVALTASFYLFEDRELN
jgi:ABC-2 type transport system permease protein